MYRDKLNKYVFVECKKFQRNECKCSNCLLKLLKSCFPIALLTCFPAE